MWIAAALSASPSPVHRPHSWLEAAFEQVEETPSGATARPAFDQLLNSPPTTHIAGLLGGGAEATAVPTPVAARGNDAYQTPDPSSRYQRLKGAWDRRVIRAGDKALLESGEKEQGRSRHNNCHNNWWDMIGLIRVAFSTIGSLLKHANDVESTRRGLDAAVTGASLLRTSHEECAATLMSHLQHLRPAAVALRRQFDATPVLCKLGGKTAEAVVPHARYLVKLRNTNWWEPIRWKSVPYTEYLKLRGKKGRAPHPAGVVEILAQSQEIAWEEVAHQGTDSHLGPASRLT